MSVAGGGEGVPSLMFPGGGPYHASYVFIGRGGVMTITYNALDPLLYRDPLVLTSGEY